MIPLSKLPWRWIGVAGAVLAILWLIHSYAERRADARETEIRALWEADTAARDMAAAEAIATEAAKAEAQRVRNAEELEDAHAKLAAIAADRDAVDGLLRRARDQVRSLASSAATGERGLDALAGIAARAAEVDRRLADYDTACRRDAVRLEALQEQIRGQL